LPPVQDANTEVEFNGQRTRVNRVQQRILHLLAERDSTAFGEIVRALAGDFPREAVEEGVWKLRSRGLVSVG
jgi:hypothetical protein